MKPCDYCNGRGTYDPFTGPTTECPRCNGTGNVAGVGSADETRITSPEDMTFNRPLTEAEHRDLDTYIRNKWGVDPHCSKCTNPKSGYTHSCAGSREAKMEDLDQQGFKSHRLFPQGTASKQAAQAAEAARRHAIANAPRVLTTADRLRNSFVDVKFHPGLNLGTVRGDIVDVESFGHTIMRITLSENGTVHDIGMHDVESVSLVGAHAADAVIWPRAKSTTSKPGVKFKVKVHVRTTLCGTDVATGDAVEVHTTGNGIKARYVGILQAVNIHSIEVAAQHGVDTLPIDIIDSITVTFATGGMGKLNHTPTKGPGFASGGLVKPGDKRYTTATAPAGTPVYYDRGTGLWTTDKKHSDGGCAHIFGAKSTLFADPWIDPADLDDVLARFRKDCQRMRLGKAYGMGPAKFARANHDINRFAHWLDGDIIEGVDDDV